MKVKNYMFTKICTVSPDMTIKEVIGHMVENRANSVFVVDKENKPLGVLSSHTLIREVVPAYLKDDPVFSQFGKEGTLEKYAEKKKDIKICEIMHTDFHSLSEEDAMIEAAAYSIPLYKRILPVVDKRGVLVGAITRTCIKNALYNTFYKDKRINPKNGGYCNCKDNN